MRGVLLLLYSGLAGGCAGGGNDGETDAPVPPVPILGRWNQVFPLGPTPPYEDLHNVGFYDDGTITDLSDGDDGTYVIDDGQLTTTIMRPSGPMVHTSGYARLDQRLLRGALRRDGTGDGWAGTWRGVEVNRSPQATVETQWTLVLYPNGAAELTSIVGMSENSVGATWEHDVLEGWMHFASANGTTSWATMPDGSLGRVAYESY